MFKYFLLVALVIAAVSAQNATACTAAENRNNCFKCLSLNNACFFCSCKLIISSSVLRLLPTPVKSGLTAKSFLNQLRRFAVLPLS